MKVTVAFLSYSKNIFLLRLGVVLENQALYEQRLRLAQIKIFQVRLAVEWKS